MQDQSRPRSDSPGRGGPVDRSRHRLLVVRRTPLLVTVALGLVLTACSGDDGDGDADQPLPTLEWARNADLPVHPGDFCDRIDERAVQSVVGTDPETAHYGNGERAEVAPGVVDVAHEFGCVFTADDGTRARAWVAVPPVTKKQARRIKPGKGCEDAGPGILKPGFASVCTSKRGTTTTLTGLYTDTWFGCSLTGAGPASAAAGTPEELETWCAAAVQAAATGG